jgi:psiF repeat
MRRTAQGRKTVTVRTSLLAVSLLLGAAPAWAAGTAAPVAQGQMAPQQQKMPSAAAPQGQPQMTAQQVKMKNCNADASARGLKGDARNSFMSQCLKGSTAGSAMNAAPTKEQTCMTQADNQKLAGAARASFMKKCTTG